MKLISLNVKCCNLSLANINTIIERFTELEHLSYHIPGKYVEDRELIFKAINRYSSFDFIFPKIPGRDLQPFSEEAAKLCLQEQKTGTFQEREFLYTGPNEPIYEKEIISLDFNQPKVLKGETSNKEDKEANKCVLRNCTGFEISTTLPYDYVLSWHKQICTDNYKNCTTNLKYVKFALQHIHGHNYQDFKHFLNCPSLVHISLNNIYIQRGIIRNSSISYYLSLITSCNLETFDLQGCVIYGVSICHILFIFIVQ